MTLVQEATEIMKKMPEKNQQIVVDLLRIMSGSAVLHNDSNKNNEPFKRTGQSDFNLPPDFDEHFDDANEEIARLFYGGE